MSAAATLAGLDSYGSVYEDARKAGASDADAGSYAAKAAVVSAGLTGMGLGAGKFANTLVTRIVASGASVATAGELQEAALEQIAKNYDPKAGYDFDTERFVINAVMGGAIGGLHHYMAGGTPPAAPGTTPAAPGAAAPAAGDIPPTGGGPGPRPDTSGPGARAKPGEAPKTAAEAESEDSGPQPPKGGVGPDFKFTSPEKRSAMEGVVDTISRRNGWGLNVKGMSDAELWNAVLSDQQQAAGAKSSQAKPETPEEAKAREATARDRDEREKLKAAGWADAQIDQMTPEQRSGRAEPQASAGRRPAGRTTQAAGRNNWRRHPKTADAERPPEQKIEEPPNNGSLTTTKPASSETPPPKGETGAATTAGPSATGRRDDPITPQTTDDVAAITPTEPKSTAQAEAENYPHAHVNMPQFGLVGDRNISVETGVGQERKGVDADGEPHGPSRWSMVPTVASRARRALTASCSTPSSARIPHPPTFLSLTSTTRKPACLTSTRSCSATARQSTRCTPTPIPTTIWQRTGSATSRR